MKKKQQITKLIITLLLLVVLAGGYIAMTVLMPSEETEETEEEDKFTVKTFELYDFVSNLNLFKEEFIFHFHSNFLFFHSFLVQYNITYQSVKLKSIRNTPENRKITLFSLFHPFFCYLCFSKTLLS